MMIPFRLAPTVCLFVVILVCGRFVTPAAAQSTVLLITSEDLKEFWKPFASWKGKMGKSTKIVTTKEIARSYKGADIQDKIRKCVRHHIDRKRTQWVILGGDSLPGGKGIVPGRNTSHKSRWGNFNDIATDIYYLSPTSWDADRDGVYGEFEDDYSAITHPDGSVGLGRIPLRTAEDIRAYTAKVISYESKFPRGEFGNTMIYTCTTPGAYPKVRRSWSDHVSAVFPQGNMSHYFAHQTPWDRRKPGDYDLSPTNLVELINQKSTGKFHIHGHGIFEGWILEEEELFTSKHVRRLSNKGAYPVITTVSCFTGQFDGAEDPCISESMLRAPEAGAIAIVAPCREGKPHFLNPREDFPLMIKEGKMDGTTMTMALFWEKGIGSQLTTGEALMQTKAQLAEKAKRSATFHLCLSELNLLGDPTLAVHP